MHMEITIPTVSFCLICCTFHMLWCWLKVSNVWRRENYAMSANISTNYKTEVRKLPEPANLVCRKYLKISLLAENFDHNPHIENTETFLSQVYFIIRENFLITLFSRKQLILAENLLYTLFSQKCCILTESFLYTIFL